MLRFWVDLIAANIQNYIATCIIYMIFPMKETKGRSYLIIFTQLSVAYFLVNYFFSATPIQRIGCGVIVYCIFGVFCFKGSRFRQVLFGVLEYMMFLVMDLALQFFLFPDFIDIIEKLPPLDQKLIGRNMATASIFLVYIVCEMIVRRKEGKKRKGIMILAFIFSLVQLEILNILTISNPEGVLGNRIVITTIFSFILIGGFLIVKELFSLIIKRQHKQAEIEQMKMEKEYQYNYYQKALAQGERLRDMRHDMRNQLQTVSCLLCSETDEDRKRAEEMLGTIVEKIG